MEKQPGSWTPYILFGIFALPFLSQLLIVEPFAVGSFEKPFLIYGGFGSAAAGAAAIFHVVRKFNRRDDPRHTKVPPDPP